MVSGRDGCRKRGSFTDDDMVMEAARSEEKKRGEREVVQQVLRAQVWPCSVWW